MSDAYPDLLRDSERERLRLRRPPDAKADVKPRLSVAVSGGGIRSATFALGFFQGLAEAGLIPHIDYLSTVSGGGYFGSFLGRLFTRDVVEGPDDVAAVLQGDTDKAPGIPWLREHGRYLAPTGSGDLLLAGAVMLRNWVSLQVVLGSFVLLLLVLLQVPALAAMRYLPVWWDRWSALARAAAPAGWELDLYVGAAAAVVLVLAAPSAWAYWLVGRRRGLRPREALGLYGLPVGLVAVPLVWWAVGGPPPAPLIAGGTIAGLSLLAAGVAGVAYGSAEARRNKVSRWLKASLLAAAGLLGLAACDALGATLYQRLQAGTLTAWLSSVGGVLVAAAGFGRRIVVAVSPSGDARPKASRALLASGAALAVGVGYLAILAVLAQAAAHGFRGAGGGYAGSLGPALLAAGVLAVAVLLLGGVVSFLNRSSHHALYMARLVRAYLGATNRNRAGKGDVLEPHPDDDADLSAYHAATHQERGMPLHLVNMTINETIDGRSQVQQQDRKGTTLAVGPCGLSVGVRHHAVFEAGHAPYGSEAAVTVFPPGEKRFRALDYGDGRYRGGKLSLGSVVAISGAAFTTGLGYRTNAGLSLLLGLANVRLGYWWDSGVGARGVGTPVPRFQRWLGEALPVYSFLFGELLARFRGTAWRHWYLSDGGHFENMGAYELIRRRVPLILLLDAEADPTYEFEGLANLVRKARIDFGAEIQFLDDAKLDVAVSPKVRAAFGPLASLRRHADRDDDTTPPTSTCHFALAEVLFDHKREGWLLYAKPTLTGDEPADLIEYLSRHRAYPHESTGDQFFDESQWESYRRLGLHLADQLRPGIASAHPWWLAVTPP